MKNFIKISICLFVLILSVGCGNNKEKLLTCTLNTKDATQGYEINSKYEVTAKGNAAVKAVTTEEITSNNTQVLKYFEETLNSTYKTYNDNYGGYTYKVTNENNKVTSNVTVDYEKLNFEKFIADQPAMKNYLTKNNKLKLDGLKSMYEQLGATCTLK